MSRIVTVNVFQQSAPLPITLQQCGAVISQGATILAPGAFATITQPADLIPIIQGGGLVLTTIVWSGGVATATAMAPHGLVIGDPVELTVVGCIPVGYNGSFICTPITTTQFTYPLAANPGVLTTAGAYSLEDIGELNADINTHFAQGASVVKFVLELGEGDVNDGVEVLQNYINLNPNSAYQPGDLGFFYSYDVPRSWDGNSNFIALMTSLNGNTAMTYFYVTTTLQSWPLYANVGKSCRTLIEAFATGAWPQNQLMSLSWSSGGIVAQTTTNHGVLPGQWFQFAGCIPAGYNVWYLALEGTTLQTLVAALPTNPGAVTTLGTLVASITASTGVAANEFSVAAPEWVQLHYAPNSNNRVTPWNYSDLFSVTPFPRKNNGALLNTLQNAFVNVVGTGGEGGLTNTILWGGKGMDGKPANYWYSVDWFSLNADVNVSNAVINGSNNPLAPLYYSQDGIDTLQDVVASTAASAVTFGLGAGQVVKTQLDAHGLSDALRLGTYAGQIVVNAVPITPYLTAAPNDYANGLYSGISVVYIPQLGFDHIVINVLVTQFLTP